MWVLERETGIEPATNGLGSRYSTIELLPPGNASIIAGVPFMAGSASASSSGYGRVFLSLFGLLFLLGTRQQAVASPQGNLSAWLTGQDATLGSGTGTIVVDQPGRIEAPVTLHQGHSLELRAPVAWAATVRLAGSNTVQCVGGATVSAQLPPFGFPQSVGMMLLVAGGTGIKVEGCKVNSSGASLMLAGYPVSDLEMTGNTLSGMMLLAVNGDAGASQRLNISKNVVTGVPSGSKFAGMQLNNAKNVTVSGNSFTKVMHGAMWWGGDAGAPGANLKQVTTTGAMTFTGNQCKDIGGACIWGSMGYDIVMRGNTADGCGDVCFDAEGGLRTQMVGNTATGCNNGCAGVFFFTDQTTISGNHFRAQAPGGGLIFIKNSSQNPVAHDHMTIEDNELRCEPKLCRSVYQEAAGGIRFVSNEVTNGVWLPLAYSRSVVISNNHLVYTQQVTGVPAAIWAPGLIGGTALEVTGNRIESNVAQLPATACISAGWTDFNATDYHLISGNTCGGSAPFSGGIGVTNDGKNPGVAGVWIVSANQISAGKVFHAAKTPNERFLDLGECGAGGGCQVNQAAVNGAKAIPGCGGRMPAAAGGAMPVCLGPVRGWGTAALPH